MANYHTLFGQIAGFVAIIPVVPYVISILRKKTRPERASWVIWFVVGLLFFASYWASGAQETIWVALSYVLFPAIVLPLALKFGVGGFTRFDLGCLAGALIGLVLWIFTKDPRITLYIIAAIDIIGYLPTIKKTFREPDTEDKMTWVVSSIAGVLNLLAVVSWTQFHIYFYPLYIFGLESFVTLMIFRLIPGQQRAKA